MDEILSYLPENLKNLIAKLSFKKRESMCEIRIRTKENLQIRIGNNIEILPYKCSENEIKFIFDKACDFSLYGRTDEISQGFVTTKGGHRIGIAGTAVKENGKVKSIKNISSLNIRIAKEVIGCAKELLNNSHLKNSGFLIVGPPSSGKTTLLRDIARILSREEYRRVTIIDERNEIASVRKGIPQYSAGMCDILTGYSKKDGIIQAIRTLAPEFIICDEIGNSEDALSLAHSLNSGVFVIASMHAQDEFEFSRKIQSKEILSTGAFNKIVFVSCTPKIGTIEKIIGVEKLENTRDNFNFHICDTYRTTKIPQTFFSC